MPAIRIHALAQLSEMPRQIKVEIQPITKPGRQQSKAESQ
jgi:hypothetical protein